jgi:DNA replication protein DnaC
MSELITARIRAHATRLGLPGIAEDPAALAARAEHASLGYLDFLDLVLGEEAGLKDSRRARAALHASGLPHHKTLDEFDFTFQPGLDVRKIRDLAALAFIQAKANVALLGPPGAGKSHLACSLAVAACHGGYSVLYATLDHMVRRLRAADASGRLPSQLKAYSRPALLVIDEVGYLPLDRADANRVFQLISGRYEKGSIIITSNKAFSKAHMFAATCARRCLKYHGFGGRRRAACRGDRGARHRTGVRGVAGGESPLLPCAASA